MEKAHATEIGQIVRQARKSKGMSAEELAKKMNPPVTYGAVLAWETGKNRLKTDVISQISEILEIDIQSFFPQEEPKEIFIPVDKTAQEIFELSEFYAKMNDTQRKAVLAVASAMVD